MPTEPLPVFRPPEGADSFGPRGRASTRGRMLGATARIRGPEAGKTAPLIRETVGEWARCAQERMRKANSLGAAKRATDSVRHLPETIRSQWESHLTLLTTYATRTAPDGSTGDPIAILRHIFAVQGDLATLRKLAAPIGNSDTLRAVQLIHDAYESFHSAIGQGHPAVHFINPLHRNDRLSKRGGDLARMGLFIAGAGAFVISGLLAAFSKPEDRNLKIPGMYLAVAGLAAGWGEITMKGDERLDRQIGFLTEPAGRWETLQNEYRLLGPDWAQYIRNYYRSGLENPLVVSGFAAERPLGKEERAAIMALAPARIHRQLERMLNGQRGAVHAADWKLMTGFLNGATSDDARGIITAFVDEGVTRESLAILNRGTRR